MKSSTVRKVLSYVRKHSVPLVLSILLSAVTVGLTLYVPILVGSAIDCIPFSTNARATPAVPSGLSVMLRLPLSLKVYISLLTISVVSPTPRRKTSVCSNVGVLISLTLNFAATSRAVFSTNCHLYDSCGKTSLVPFGILTI